MYIFTSGIIGVNFNWLANIKKLKIINKMTVAVYHFLSTLINTMLEVSILLSSITLKKHQHL